MQLNKKTRNIAEETVASAPQSSAGEGTPNPRTNRSSKQKKTETTESGSVNHHHKASSAPTAEKPKAAAVAAAGPVAASIADPVGIVTPAVESELINKLETASALRDISHQEVATLAYSYWIARGYPHGNPEEDWLRAERELNAKR